MTFSDKKRPTIGANQEVNHDDVKKLLNEGLNKIDETQAEIKQYSDEIIEKIRENPLKAVLIAGGIGVLLSVLLKK